MFGFLKRTDYNEPNQINDGMKSTLVLILGEMARQGKSNNHELMESKVINIIMVYV
jgi:hypothetical protein